jgi:hypothetical protein
LSQEELPDFYEENLPHIASIMSFLIDIDYNFKTVPSELIKARAKVVRLVHLYTFKFGEHFNNYFDAFF